MAMFNKEGMLVTKNGKHPVAELQTKLSFVSGTYLVEFLKSIGLSVPRRLRMRVLSQVLKDSVERTIEERKSLADEMGYRLTWFNKFTDTQLVNLLEWYKSTALDSDFLLGIWKQLLNYMVDKGVGDSDLERLFDAANAAYKTKKHPLTKDFNKAMNLVLYDENGEIDGVTQDQFRPVTYKATTLTELRAIGEKYNAPIPKRLRKSEMLDVILDKLKERNELTPELDKKLSNQNIILLERFAKDHNIKVSTELKKEEIIEFILSNAEETKSIYFAPQSQEAYENLDEPVVEKSVPKLAPTPEPKPEPVVVESVKAPTPSVVVHTEQIDYRPQLDKLAEAFNKLAHGFEQKEFSVKIQNNMMAEALPQPEVVQKEEQVLQKQAPSNILVSQEVLIRELLKEDDSDAPELDPTEPFDLDNDAPIKVFKYKRGVGFIASMFALIFAAGFAWLALLSFGLLIAPFLVEANQMFADLDAVMQLVVTYGSIVFSAVNLYVFLRLLMKPGKRELKWLGFISLFTGLIITGLLVFGSIGSKIEKIETKETSETARLAQAIEKLNEPGKTKKVKTSSRFMMVLLSLITFVLIIFVVLYVVWRLEFTYGYENIPFIGPFLRDSIIEPLFGSAHNLS